MGEKFEYEKCVLAMVERTNDSIGTIIVPKGVFEHALAPCRFIAIKRSDSDFIKLLPIGNKDYDVYELYAEVKYGALGAFVTIATKTAKDDINIKFVPELINTCPSKNKEVPCVFDGFFLIKGGVDKANDLKDRLSNIVLNETDTESIVLKIEVTKIG